MRGVKTFIFNFQKSYLLLTFLVTSRYFWLLLVTWKQFLKLSKNIITIIKMVPHINNGSSPYKLKYYK